MIKKCPICRKSKIEKRYDFSRISILDFGDTKKSITSHIHTVYRCNNCNTDYTVINNH